MYKTPANFNGHLMAAVDIETTGRMPGFHEIIQIAVVPLDSEFEPLQKVLPFYITLAPKYPERAEKKAKKIHGLNLEKLTMDSLDQSKVADLFIEWFNDLEIPLNKRLIPLAHNWAFESGFLKHWLGLETMDYIWQGTARDTMSFAGSINDWHWLRGENPPFVKLNLQYLCKKLKIIQKGKPHDALNDSLACVDVYKILLQQYPLL